MNITKAIIQFRTKLIADINEAGLPPVVVGLVLDGVKGEVERLTAEELRREERADEHRDDAEPAE